MLLTRRKPSRARARANWEKVHPMSRFTFQLRSRRRMKSLTTDRLNGGRRVLSASHSASTKCRRARSGMRMSALLARLFLGLLLLLLPLLSLLRLRRSLLLLRLLLLLR